MQKYGADYDAKDLPGCPKKPNIDEGSEGYQAAMNE